MRKIGYNKPYIIGNELEYISEAVIKNAKISGDGDFTKKCHQWLEKELGCKKALLTHSCTGALEMSAILADIQAGDEVIMPSFTFVSTANAFVLRGAVPVFVDIRPDTLNIDESLIESAITAKTKAIVPVHYAGYPCEMDSIMKIAERYNLIVIEDAAQALFSTYKGKKLGTIGHFGTISFHETKNIISGEGGALLINDEQFISRAEIIWEKGTNRKAFLNGMVDKYSWVDIGSSFLPSEITAAFLYAQLEKAEEIIDKRIKIFNHYYKELKDIEELQLPFLESANIANGHIFYIIAETAEKQKELLKYLKSLGILAIFHYIPLHSSPAGLKYGRVYGKMENTDKLSQQIIRLPLYYELEDSEINFVIESIKKIYK